MSYTLKESLSYFLFIAEHTLESYKVWVFELRLCWCVCESVSERASPGITSVTAGHNLPMQSQLLFMLFHGYLTLKLSSTTNSNAVSQYCYWCSEWGIVSKLNHIARVTLHNMLYTSCWCNRFVCMQPYNPCSPNIPVIIVGDKLTMYVCGITSSQ